MTTNSKQVILSATLFSLLTVGAFANPVFADDCVTQYGGSQYGSSCAPNDLVINKEVQQPGHKDANGNPVYVENLSTADAVAGAGTFMTFRLTIKNNSGQTFDPVEVKDIFPPFMKYVSGGPSGTVYDDQSRTMTVHLDKMIAGESRQLIIVAQVTDDKTQFPSGQSTFCVVNTAQARALNRFDEDTAQVCIATPQVKGVSTLPKAGFDDLALLIPFAFLGLTGIGFITKKI